MATLEQLEAAFIKADDAGNTEDAKAFANEIRRLRSGQPEVDQAGPLDARDARVLQRNRERELMEAATGLSKPPLAVGAMALPKLGASIADLIIYAPRKLREAISGVESPFPTFSDLAQRGENALADEDLSKNNLAKLGSAGIQSLVFPGSLVKNLAAAEIGELSRQGTEALGGGPTAQFIASLGGGLAGAKGTSMVQGIEAPDITGALARSRLRGATSEMLPEEVIAAQRAQEFAKSQGQWISPWQAFDRDVPKLKQLEEQIRGSAAPAAVKFQQKTRAQLPEAEKLSKTIVDYLTPRSRLSASADEAVNAANQAAGDIRRMPNVLTAGLYEKGMTGVRPVAKTDLTGLIDRLQSMKLENKGNLALERVLYDMTDEIAARTEATMTKAGTLRPNKNISAAEAVRLSDSFTDRLKDFAVQNPSQSQRASQITKEAANLLDQAAYKAQPSLERATMVNRVMRDDFRVGDFDPLAAIGKTKAEPASVVKGLFERGIKDPKEFATTVKQIEAKDINAVPNALGHHIRQVWDKVFSTKAFKEEAAPVMFANDLIGTASKRESMQVALEAVGRANKAANPAAYADGVIKRLELIRNLGKQGGADYSRLGQTQQSAIDAAKMTFGHGIQAGGARTNIAMKAINRLSDSRVASLLNEPDSVSRMMQGQIGGNVSFRQTPYELILLNAMNSGLLGPQE